MNKNKLIGELTQTIIKRRVKLKVLIKLDKKIRKLHTKLIKNVWSCKITYIIYFCKLCYNKDI